MSVTDQQPANEMPRPKLPPRRLGLSGKLLLLTIPLVMIAGMLIYVPSIGNFHMNRLNDRLAAANTAALVLDAAPRADVRRSVVVTLDGHQYGLVVDQVDDVCVIPGGAAPVRARLGRGWADAAHGMLDHAGESILLLDPAALVRGPQARAA